MWSSVQELWSLEDCEFGRCRIIEMLSSGDVKFRGSSNVGLKRMGDLEFKKKKSSRYVKFRCSRKIKFLKFRVLE